MKTRHEIFSTLAASGSLASVLALAACSPATASPVSEVDGPEPDVQRGSAKLGGDATVQDAITASCSTTSVLGLSQQIVEQMNCANPGALADLPERPNLTKSDATFAYLQPAARDALVAALDANPGKTLSVNSMFRTVAQQYVLARWGQSKSCGVALAAKPGSSNHESGLALDTSEYSSWKTALTAHGFKWFGSADKVHFDFVAGGTANLKGSDVLAFQVLWNRNHPDDAIGEDGAYGTQTGKRLAKAPANGFTLGATCTPAPTDDPNADPVKGDPPNPDPNPGTGASPNCAGHCGASDPLPGSNPNCYCDDACSSYGDCCSDHDAVCGASAPSPDPAPSTPSCADHCGSSDPVPGSSPACYCDASCVSVGDCCGDVAVYCGF